VKTDLYRIIARTDDEVDSRDADRFLRHLVSLMATKLADGLIDPKLVLAWIMAAVGAPGYLIGALVPVRESGALLPQILLARQIQRRSIRKTFWAVGSAIQGVAAIGIGVAALTLQGDAAGWAVIGCLAVLSLARAACSASYKDVAARTIRSGERGTVSGAAGTISAAAVFAYAALLSIGWIPREIIYVATAILLAGGLWMVAAILFAGLDEPEDDRATDVGTGRVTEVLQPLREDLEFRTYILVRGLLISTALAPPFLVMLSNAAGDSQLGNLGLFMLASSAAAIASSYVWGRASDWSSRLTLQMSGLLATVALGGAGLLGLSTGGIGGSGLAAAFIFVAQIAYEGVRAGRKTHLTDMDTGGQKAVYTALSNTLIGVLLVLGGGFGVIADLFGPAVVLLIFAGLSAAAAVAALGLREQQGAA
jgi:hypothetical protein